MSDVLLGSALVGVLILLGMIALAIEGVAKALVNEIDQIRLDISGNLARERALRDKMIATVLEQGLETHQETLRVRVFAEFGQRIAALEEAEAHPRHFAGRK